jgi:tRNA G26 N,N-dimethylase Trm1
VNAAVVERMEEQLKADVLAEMRQADGRILLHDEVEIKPGHYDIVPIWETIQESEVMTPKELYDQVQAEGYKVDYLRIAIVSDPALLH